MEQSLRVCYFPGSFAAPLLAATDLGLFGKRGLAPELVVAAGSTGLITGLVEGQFNIGYAAIDHAIAHADGHGGLTFSRPPDLFAAMGGTFSNLAFVVRPDITNYNQLRGMVLAVDAPTTGFAFVLRRVLQLAGLAPSDYKLSAVGADPARLAALRAGTHAGTLLTPDWAAIATSEGLNILCWSLDLLRHYQGTCFLASRTWASHHRLKLVAFLAALIDALEWIFQPGGEGAVAELLMHHQPELDRDAARQQVRQLCDPRHGLARHGEIDLLGVQTVIELRQAFASRGPSDVRPSRYIDLSYLEAARSASSVTYLAI